MSGTTSWHKEEKAIPVDEEMGEDGKDGANVGRKKNQQMGEKLQGQWRSSEIKVYSPLNKLMKGYKLGG